MGQSIVREVPTTAAPPEKIREAFDILAERGEERGLEGEALHRFIWAEWARYAPCFGRAYEGDEDEMPCVYVEMPGFLLTDAVCELCKEVNKPDGPPG